MSDALLVSREGAVLTITLNRPARLNAFRRAEYGQLHEVLGDLEQDAGLRVVILTGAGRGFCAGEDLKELEGTVTQPGVGVTRDSVELLQNVTRRIAQSDKVYIAAVNGVAAGFGAELSVACDLRIAGSAARFLFPEVSRGLFITNGVSCLLPRVVGTTWALTLLLTGDSIDAVTAERIGLVTQVIPNEALLPEARRLAASIASNAPTAVRLTKRILRPHDDPALERALATEVEYLEQCLQSGEHIEGARAFIEKRTARFSG